MEASNKKITQATNVARVIFLFLEATLLLSKEQKNKKTVIHKL